ncbi:hypothetical protein [Gynuella sp.]|uniref:hypothetical protein n=1 Tax=Gynuella sp. TaxID=2969146 RepID=UPI003D0A0738
MAQVSVGGAKVSLSPVNPVMKVDKLTDVINGGAQTVINVNGKAALIENDIQNWVDGYVSNYTYQPYVTTPGMIKGKSFTLKTVAENARAGKNLVLASTEIELTVEVQTPAIFVPPPPGKPESDSTKEYTLKVIFTDPGQDAFTST